jgi:hypothetical protein
MGLTVAARFAGIRYCVLLEVASVSPIRPLRKLRAGWFLDEGEKGKTTFDTFLSRARRPQSAVI